jgi:hypothetical protein
MSKATGFVPNSFQTPNAYVDQFMPFLTGEEYKVLIYATRRILGFQKRQDRISISQFTDGTKNKDGEILDSGTGLSIETVKKCLANLVVFGLMVRLEENDPRTNEGVLWGLQWDENKINWQALEERESKKAKVDGERMKKARSMRQAHPPSDIPPSVPQAHPRSMPQAHPSPNGIETQKTEETQGNPELINKPALDLFKGCFGKFLSEKELKRWLILSEAAGWERAEELTEWALKKEIHLENRPGLLDSLETAAKNWREKPKRTNGKTPAPADDWLTRKERELANG